MSGCYDNYDYCGYKNDWDNDYCYKPRRHYRRQYECYSYEYSYCN